MKRETVETAIRTAFPEATDEQVKGLLESVMAQNGKEVGTYVKRIEAAEGEANRLKDIETQLAEMKKSSLTAEEQLKLAQEDAERVRREYSVKSNRLDIEKSFVAAGFKEDDYAGLLDAIVTDDAKASRASADALLGMLSKQKEEVSKALKKELLTQTPEPSTGASGTNASSVVSPEQFTQAQASGDFALMASLIRRESDKQAVDTSKTY